VNLPGLLLNYRLKTNIMKYFSGALLFFMAILCQQVNAQTSGTGLFDQQTILDITLSGNLKDMMGDRSDAPKLYPITLSYKGADSVVQTLSIESKTRGHFRKQKGVCDYPPLLLHFNQDEKVQGSLFRDQKNLKLVMPCDGDEYVVREYLAYKIYNLVTPQSFRARLVRVTLDDPKRKKTNPFYGVLLEEESQVAKRNGLVAVERKIIPEQVEHQVFLNMTTFEYLIGNTDWSVQYLQNIKLLAADSLAVPNTVPYDFDHAGIVNVPYAKPAEELEMSSVKERRYRGYCITDMKQFDSTIALFNRLREPINKLYSDNPILDAKYIKSTLQYLDEFYATINNPKSLQKEFGYPCDKNGTGNVIIRGLKKDQ